MKIDANDNDFFGYLDFAITYIKDSESKIKFLEGFFKNALGIDDIEDSIVTIGEMRSKTLFYLMLLMIITYEDRETVTKTNDSPDLAGL